MQRCATSILRLVSLVTVLGASVALSACEQKGGPLKVDSVEPSEGTTNGGDQITIVGSGFEPGKTQAEVRFGRRRSENVVIASTTKIIAVTPVGDRGPVDVSVMFDSGQAFKIPGAFHYAAPAAGSDTRKAFFSGNTAPKPH